MTPKQETFVAEYLKDLNATQAAIRAGYSAKTAEAIGYENLRKPQVAEAIQAGMNARAERTAITQDSVLTRINAIVDATTETDPKAALKGLELLGRHLKLFTDKVEHGGEGLQSLADAISAARTRIASRG